MYLFKFVVRKGILNLSNTYEYITILLKINYIVINIYQETMFLQLS